MQYHMNCQFEVEIPEGVTRSQIEDAVEPMLSILNEDLGVQENIDRSADVWFNGDIAVACVNAYVGHDFPDAFAASCIALGKVASRPFTATFSNEDGNGPEPALLEIQYGPLAASPVP